VPVEHRDVVWRIGRGLSEIPDVDEWPEKVEDLDDDGLIIAEADPADLNLVRAHSISARAALAVVRDYDLGQMGNRLRDGDAHGIRVAGTWYRLQRDFKWRQIDDEGVELIEWIEREAGKRSEPVHHAVRAIFNPNYARVTGLRATAERWGFDPYTIQDTFMERVTTTEEDVVKTMRIVDAPKFAQALDDGEMWSDPRKRGEE
jgi:hypothetical protein